MRRATPDDATQINAILNDPLVRPTIGVEGQPDATNLLKDARNRLYFDGRGGAIFAWRGPGIYEGHSFFRARGRDAIRAGRECLDLMADARMIWGNTPESNRAARWFNRQLGFRSLGMIDVPELGRCELFVLEN
jgi:hypothetical protein